MNLLAIKEMVMHQTNNDADDLGDYMPYLEDYINEGYDRLVVIYAGVHVDENSEVYTPLTHDKSIPELPAWTHRAIADWATWLCYRNGNTQKQSRGYQYRNSFTEVESKLRSMGVDENGLRTVESSTKKYIVNIPR